jgi:hypothetical protein
LGDELFDGHFFYAEQQIRFRKVVREDGTGRLILPVRKTSAGRGLDQYFQVVLLAAEPLALGGSECYAIIGRHFSLPNQSDSDHLGSFAIVQQK